MPTSQEELLGKAAQNVARVRDFFAARQCFRIAPGGEDALRRLHDALRSGVDSALEPLLQANRLMVPVLPSLPHVAQLPAAELEPERVERFAAFVRELSGWFASQAGVVVSDTGRELLAAIVEAMLGTALSVERLLAVSGGEVECFASELGGDSTPRPAGRPNAESIADGASSRERSIESEPLLVLEDSERTPMLQTFRGVSELSFEVKQRIQDFLAQAGVEYDSYQLARFLRKVQQWVEATPNGTVLVIRASSLSGRSEPYPSYVSKRRVAATAGDQLQPRP